jgi:hypothetical protein
MIPKLKEFKRFPRIDIIRLGRTGEDFFESGELQVVDIEEAIIVGSHLGVQWPSIAIVSFHRHSNGTAVNFFVFFNT